MIDRLIYLNYFVYALAIFLVGMFIYLFHRKSFEQKIEKEQSKKKLLETEEVNYTRQIFLAAISHQLHTSLAGAKWSMESLLQDRQYAQSELIKESLKRINDSIAIANKMLHSAELETKQGNIPIKHEEIDLKLLVDKIISDQNYLIKFKEIKLEYGTYESVIIKGDEKMLHLSLTNIIDNAFRYSPQGTVKLSLYKSGEDAALLVEDNGVGIDPKDLKFITFQKFYRGKNAERIDPDESGMGLYVTKKILEIHKGSMVISSTLGKGTKVSVLLPTAVSA